MVLQYRLKSEKKGSWKKYPGKAKLKEPVSKYTFRLLNEEQTKILVPETNYARVMKRFRQIEFFKHRG